MREIVTHRTQRFWRLAAAVLVVLGLAVSAPPAIGGMPGDHFGVLVHPILPHEHGNGHTFTADDAITNLASHDPASSEVAPGWSVPLASSGAREAAAGVVLPFVLAATLFDVSRRRQLFEPSLVGRLVSPPTPPPRVLTSIV